MAMRYDEVNQLAFSKASRSAAMEDCVVVRIEILVAMKTVNDGSYYLSQKLIQIIDTKESRHGWP